MRPQAGLSSQAALPQCSVPGLWRLSLRVGRLALRFGPSPGSRGDLVLGGPRGLKASRLGRRRRLRVPLLFPPLLILGTARRHAPTVPLMLPTVPLEGGHLGVGSVAHHAVVGQAGGAGEGAAAHAAAEGLLAAVAGRLVAPERGR